MRFPWQDKRPLDGKPDDYPIDTWGEIYLLGILGVLILIAFFVVLGYVTQ